MQNQLILGDSVQALQALKANTVDFILTDPPYLVNYRSRDNRRIKNDVNHDWLKPTTDQLSRVLKNNAFMLSFYGYTQIEKFMNSWKQADLSPVGHFVGVKDYASGKGHTQRKHENAYLLAKGNPKRPSKPLPDVLPWEYSRNKYHPTQKPLSMMEKFIETFTKPGDLVLDPFAGSATTAIAAARTGRRFIGIELDPEYFNQAKARLEAEAINFSTNLGVSTMTTKSINQVTILGNLGDLPEIKDTKNGRMAKLRIATNEGYKKDDQFVEKTSWHSVTCFQPFDVELLERGVSEGFIEKGTRIHVTAKLQYSTTETDDGEKRHFTDIVVTDIILL